MKTLKSTSLLLLSIPALSIAQLYGVSHGSAGMDTLYTINTTTGAATAVFSFANGGSINTSELAYNPVTNKLITIQTVSAFQSRLVEIDHVAMTATAVSHGIPTNFFEGVEYSSSLGGLVVGYGPGGFFSGKLSLLNNSYGLINSNASTGFADTDCLFVDGSGDLNVLDDNYNMGFQRNKIFNPFSGMTTSPFGGSIFAWSGNTVDYDLAWKGDEGRLFLTRKYSLATVNATSTVITSVGSYGISSDGTEIAITGLAVVPVPEPASAMVLAIGAAALLRRRR